LITGNRNFGGYILTDELIRVNSPIPFSSDVIRYRQNVKVKVSSHNVTSCARMADQLSTRNTVPNVKVSVIHVSINTDNRAMIDNYNNTSAAET
jgi:hypothetical protein